MRQLFRCAAGLVLCCVAIEARANFLCQAIPADFLGIDAGGTVLTSIEGTGRIKICNLERDHAGIGAQTCAGWYSTLLTARSKVSVYFDETNPLNVGSTSCATLGEWVVRVPYYLEFEP